MMSPETMYKELLLDLALDHGLDPVFGQPVHLLDLSPFNGGVGHVQQGISILTGFRVEYPVSIEDIDFEVNFSRPFSIHAITHAAIH